ncbi:MAG: flavin reductase family protein [Clostridiales bacterium]|nr:flavin reductase family protein [Clostridiales bacterium]
MNKNFGPQSWAYPMPVLIIAAYDDEGRVDVMNAAWGSISGGTQISMCLSPGHKTVKSILTAKAFTVSMGDAAHIVECDYVGIVSGNDVPDKFEKSGFHATKSEFVNAPIIDQLPMRLECKLTSYDEESHCMIGEIINVSADERILDGAGNIDPEKLQPIAYDPINHYYHKLGEKVGNAFEDGNKIK